MVTGLSTAWEAARKNVERAQQKQKIAEPKTQDSELEIVCSCMFCQISQAKPTSLPSHIAFYTE